MSAVHNRCLFAVKVVENKHAYFAERLYHSMKVVPAIAS